MGVKAEQIKLRLFLEGIECPIISAQVISQPNSPAQAAIQIPPTAFATKLLPRTTVHLFFADPYEKQNPLVSYLGPDQRPEKQAPTAYEISKQRAQERKRGEEKPSSLDEDFAADVRNVHYKLLFAGEVHGFQWTKNASQRSVVLQCVDFSNYWDYAWQFNNTDLFGPGMKALFSGGSTNLLTDFLSSPGEMVTALLHQKSAQYPALKGFLGGLIRMLESIGGYYYGEKTFGGQNVFYSLAELRLHITQMITTYPEDDTASKLLNAGGYDGLFGRVLGNLGEQVSIRSVLTALMGIIFYEAQSVPSPFYVPASGGSVNTEGRKRIQNIPNYYSIYADAVLVASDIDDFIEVLSGPALTGEAPKGDPKKNKAAFFARYKSAKGLVQEALIKSRQLGLTQATGPLSAAFNAMGVAQTKLTRDWKPGTFPGKKIQDIISKLRDAQKELRTVENLEVPSISKKQQTPARLCSHIFKPDVWFGAPPRCNILFPDHYTQLEYSRSFMREPTRLLLKTNDEFFGEDELFDQFYFAPRVRTVKGQKKTLQQLFQNDIFDHELFTGVLPVFEKMGELNIFAVRSGTVKGKTPKVGLAQRSANFLYFKHRFAAREMSVSARFNPYLAPGFPALVIDKYVDPDAAKTYTEKLVAEGKQSPGLKALLGTHFLGSITEMAHSVSQREGRTDLRFAFPREYDEITEFFGPSMTDDQEVQQRFGTDALRDTLVAALSPPPFNAIGPNFGVINQVVDVSSSYTNPDPQTAFRFPLWSGPRRSGTGQLSVTVPCGPVLPASEFGKEVVDLVGNPRALVKFNVYQIKEKVPRYRRTVVDLPAEELIRPGWYSDAWHPSKVGSVYYNYLGTGAITDKTQVADPNGVPTFGQKTGGKNTQEIDALAEMAQAKDGEDPKFASAVALLTLDKDSSIEQAVKFLLLTYSYIRSAGLDTDAFVKAYTWRPIATMVDMFGSSDFNLSKDGTAVVSGIEGFHSRAFGPYNDLFGLVTPEITEILGIKKTDTARERGDVRGRRRSLVVDYITSLQYARALIG